MYGYKKGALVAQYTWDRSFMVDPLSYLAFQPVLHDGCKKGYGIYYPVCGMVHIKELLLLIEKTSPYSGGSGFPILLFEWFFTTCIGSRLICILSHYFRGFVGRHH